MKKNRKWTAAVLSCLWMVMLLIPSAGYAAKGSDVSADLLYREQEDGTVIVTGLVDPDFAGVLVIPDAVDGLPVAGIDAHAFSGYGITSLMILEGLEQIGDGAFAGCPNLQDVRIPESAAASAAESAVGEGVFRDCPELTDVFLPDSWTAIPAWTFAGCTSLVEVGCSVRTSVIGDHAFDGCSAFEYIGAPEADGPTVATIGEGAFRGTALAAVVLSEVPDVENTAGAYAFADCPVLQFLEIHVAGLGDHLAAGSALQEVVFGSEVSAVPEAAFAGCGSLQAVQLASSVQSIGADAFSGCSALSMVYYFGTPAQYMELEIASGNEALQDAEVLYLPNLTIVETEDGSRFVEGLTAAPTAQTVSVVREALGVLAGVVYDSAGFLRPEGPALGDEDPVGTGTIAFWMNDDLREVQATVVMRGDVTGSGILSIAQLVRMAQALNGSAALDPAQQLAADLNGSGSVNIADLVMEANLLTEA